MTVFIYYITSVNERNIIFHELNEHFLLLSFHVNYNILSISKKSLLFDLSNFIIVLKILLNGLKHTSIFHKTRLLTE